MIEIAVVIGLPDLVLGILAGFKVSVPLGWKQSIVLGLLGFAGNRVVKFIFIQ